MRTSVLRWAWAPAALALGACAPVASSTRAAAPPATPAPVRPAHPADAAFVQHMIVHHAQALVMAELVPRRTSRPELRALAERITISQKDEIATMARWLARRGLPFPDTSVARHPEHHGEHAAMPGMLSGAELERLATLQGEAFDRAFLTAMIRHHEGALEMVAQLSAQPGALQEAEIFTIASEIEADQRAEIERMRALLKRLGGAAPAPTPHHHPGGSEEHR